MLGSRRQCVIVLALFAGLLVCSVPFMRVENARYRLGLKPQPQPLPVPHANRFPTKDLRVIHGASNVWDDREYIDSAYARNSEPVHEAAAKVFVLLKTGIETMWDRIPVHFDTTMRIFPHLAIYSDSGALLNGHIVWDCLQYLPTWVLNSDDLLGYRVRRTSVDEHWGWGSAKLNIKGKDKGVGWETDRFKNIPAFVHAWETTNGAHPWYFMIDGDTFVTGSTITAAIKDRDPDEIWYLGHGVGSEPIFAHGGSGILLSRGAMRKLFHEPTDVAWHREIIDDACKRAMEDCCGDRIVAYEFERLTGRNAEENLELEENGLFQGNPRASLLFAGKTWCTPVGTFHHVSAAEIQTLYDWENIATARKAANGDDSPLTYADFYEDFVEPFITDERANWYFPRGNTDSLTTQYDTNHPGEPHDGDEPLYPLSSKEDCRRLCEIDNECLAWEWIKDQRCRLFIEEFSLGIGFNPYSKKWNETISEIVCGHMIDRINAIHKSASCRNQTETPRKPGWYVSEMHANLSDTDLVHPLESRPLYLE